MNSRNNIDDIYGVLETIRREIANNDIPPELIRAIIQNEYTNQDSSLRASVETRKILMQYLDSLENR